VRFDGLLGLVGEHLVDRRGVSRRRQAMAVLSCLVGALMLSRAVDDPETSAEILAAARRHLRAGLPEPPTTSRTS